MTQLDMPDDQAVQPSSAQIDDYRGARQLHKLKRRLRRRVVRLSILAYVFLTLAILVLVSGTAAFAFANYIARLTLSSPQTAASQYAKLTAEGERLNEQHAALNRQEAEILNEAAITGPYNEKISTIKAEYMSLEEDILRNCPKAILNNFIDPEVGFGFGSGPERLRVTPQGRIGYYGFMLPSGKRVSFEGLNLANECQNHFEEHKEKIIEYTRQVQALSTEQSTILQENRQNKSPELVPINQRRMQLSLEIQDLGAILKDFRSRSAQEKYLGTAPTPEGHASDTTEAKIDWPHVIETNATRIGALAAMFF
jgi:hypothetical protein